MNNAAQSDSPHLSEREKQMLLRQIEYAGPNERSVIMTRLAWRPAWAIRSRRGAWRALRQLFR